MATTIVELTGDEAGLLRSLQRVIEKEREHERQLAATANAGDYAGQGLEAALERVRKAEDRTLKSLMGDLRKLGPEGQAAAQALTGHFSDTGRAGLKNFDAIIGQIQRIDPAAADVLAGVRAQFAETTAAADFDNALQSLQRLGPEGAALAKGIAADIAEASADGAGSLDDVVAEIVRMRPEVAASAERIKTELAEAARVAEFDETLQSLQRLGPEGAAIARGIQDDMKQAAAASAGGLDDVLDKIKAMDPAAAASAERVRSELAEAARFTEGRFASTLDELRKLGPVGQQVAAQMRQHLVDAGEISERSIDDVIAKIRQIDPAAAEAAKRMHEEIEAANAKGTSSFAEFGRGAIAQITAMAGAYLSVQTAIGQVNQYLKEQEQLLKNAYDKQIDLAKAQQEAAKMVAGLTAIEQHDLLNDAVPEIARASGNPNTAAITQAIGEAITSGATPAQARSAVLASATANRLTPEATPAYATAAIALARSTGRDDARDNMALLISTGTQAQLTDPKKLAINLAPAVGNSVATVPGQDRVDASREAAAIFGVLSKAATDVQGDSSRTATINFTAELGKFFSDLEKQLVDARSRVAALDKQIADETHGQAAARAERDRLQQFLQDTEGAFVAPSRDDLDRELRAAERTFQGRQIDAREKVASIDDKISKGTATEKDLFDRETLATFLTDAPKLLSEQQAQIEARWQERAAKDEQAWEQKRTDAAEKIAALDRRIESARDLEKERIERDRLAGFVTQADGMADPGTLFGRIAALQENESIRNQFFSREFGEAQFKTPFKQLADATSALAAELQQAKALISVESSNFEALVESQGGMTPQLVLANAAARQQAIGESKAVSNTEGASLEFVRQTTAEALQSNRGHGVLNAARSILGDIGIARGTLKGGTAAEEAVSAISAMIDRRSEIVADGVQPGEAKMVAQLNDTIENLRAYILTNSRELTQESLIGAAEQAEWRAGDTSHRQTLDDSGTVIRFDKMEFFEDLARDFKRVAAATEQQNKLLAEQKAIAEQQAKAAQQTADNTTPPPARQPNYAGAQQTAAAYGGAP